MSREGDASARLPNGITREVLEADGIRDVMQARHPDVPLLSDGYLRESLWATLQARPDHGATDDPVWLLAYGSLLWNPCVAVAERRLARLRGYHRDFRLRLTYGRGSPERPGLMLGLTPGGSCRGVGLRIAGEDPVHELHLVWRRELLTGVYRPRWVQLETEAGRVSAIAFVVDPRHRCYCGRIDDDGIVELLSSGHGLLGTCAEYLDNTVEALDARGIHDRRLHRLRHQVRQRRKRHPQHPDEQTAACEPH